MAAGIVVALLLAQQGADRDRRDRTTGPRPEEPGTTGPAAAGPVEQEEGPLFRLLVRNEEEEPVAGVAATSAGGGKVPDGLKTGADGTLSWRGALEDRLVSLNLHHPDYAPGSARVPSWSAEPVVATLLRGVPVTVVVRSPEQRPVAGASITGTLVANYVWHRARTATTDADGRASLGRFLAGELRLEVKHDAFAYHFEEVKVGAEPLEIPVVLELGGSIEGTVYGPGREPVPDATVASDHRKTQSGPDGRYRLEHVKTGSSHVHAAKEGYGPGHAGTLLGWGNNVPIAVTDGARVTGIDILLGRPTTVRGRIVDEQGAPVEGVSVNYSKRGGYSAFWRREPTGPDGVFTLGPWTFDAPGEVSLTFNGINHAIEPRKGIPITPGEDVDLGDIQATTFTLVKGKVALGPGVTLPADFYPSVRGGSRNAAVARDRTFEVYAPPGSIELAADAYVNPEEVYLSEPVKVEGEAGAVVEGVVLTLRPATVVAGHVVDANGRPVGWKTVHAVPEGATPPYPAKRYPAVWSDSDSGAFSFHFAEPGPYLVGLEGEKEGDTFTLASDPPPLHAVGGETDLKLVLPPVVSGPRVKGRVVSKRDGTPVTDFNVTLIRHTLFVPSHFHNYGVENEDGRFDEAAEEPGIYAVRVSAWGFSAVRTATFRLGEGEEHDVGTIALGEGGAIAGVVRDADGNGVPFTQVHAVSATLESQWNPPYTDGEGHFRQKGLAPGLYTLFAVSPTHPLCIRTGVQVEDEATTDVKLVFPRASPLVLTVLDPNGRPIEGAKLVYTFAALQPFTSDDVSEYEPPGYGSNLSDAAGVISKPCLPAGEATLRLEAEGFETTTLKLDLAPGKETRREVRLERKR